MLAQCTQLIDAILCKAANFCVVCSLAPRATDGDYFLLNDNNIYIKQLLPAHTTASHCNYKSNFKRLCF